MYKVLFLGILFLLAKTCRKTAKQGIWFPGSSSSSSFFWPSLQTNVPQIILQSITAADSQQSRSFYGRHRNLVGLFYFPLTYSNVFMNDDLQIKCSNSSLNMTKINCSCKLTRQRKMPVFFCEPTAILYGNSNFKQLHFKSDQQIILVLPPAEDEDCIIFFLLSLPEACP